MCPDCGSLDLKCEFFYGRTDPETGYNDSGEIFICRDCGTRGPADDVLSISEVVRIAPLNETTTATMRKRTA